MKIGEIIEMAVVKILQIKHSHVEPLQYIMNEKKTVQKDNGQRAAIDYISNGEKTNSGQLVTGFSCDPLTSVVEFAMTQELALESKGNYTRSKTSDVKAHHVIQSFSPEDNITPEQAHEIGKQLMQEFLGGKHEYVIATHVDKEHIHNHIVFNATSFYTHTKFRSKPYKTAAQLRSINDKLCAEHDLMVLPEFSPLKSNYQKYQKYRSQSSYRAMIRKRLNFLLETETDLNQFIRLAEQLGVDIDLSGQHATYHFEAQKRRTRDDKLSDDGRFTKEGLKNYLAQNASRFEQLENAIESVFARAGSIEEFRELLRTEYAITYQRNRSGEVQFTLADDDLGVIKERAINAGLSISQIENKLRRGQPLIREPEKPNRIEEFEALPETSVPAEESAIKLDLSVIRNVSSDGLLVEVEDATGNPGTIFIDANHVDVNSEKKSYQVYIGDQFNYYFMEDGKQTNYFLKGDALIRQLETKMNVPLKEVVVPANLVRSVGDKGVTLTLPDQKIDRLFIPAEYVRQDIMTSEVRVLLSDNWTYYFQPKQDEGKKKRSYQPMKGARLSQLLEDSLPTLDVAIANKLQFALRQSSVAEAKRMADQLALLRHSKIHNVAELSGHIDELINQLKETKEDVVRVENKVAEYNQVAKYLVAYHNYLPYMEEVQSSSLQAALLKRKYSKEIEMFHVAQAALDERGIYKDVEPEKVVDLVKENQAQLKQLQQKVDRLEVSVKEYKDAELLVRQATRKQEKEKEKNRSERELF